MDYTCGTNRHKKKNVNKKRKYIDYKFDKLQAALLISHDLFPCVSLISLLYVLVLHEGFGEEGRYGGEGRGGETFLS